MKQANAKQKKWMSDIADWANNNLGVLYFGYQGGAFELHHVLGRSAKHNKTAIGHEFIIPVPVELHNVMSNHPNNVTHFKKNFVKVYGQQRDIFKFMVMIMGNEGYDVPSLELCNAIMETSA